ncbi:MAG: hypothetical protein ACI9JD_001106 [Rhodococcus sp. (in: high G+C Gram-positive bacteria)]|jgi:hypothetical protein
MGFSSTKEFWGLDVLTWDDCSRRRDSGAGACGLVSA